MAALSPDEWQLAWPTPIPDRSALVGSGHHLSVGAREVKEEGGKEA